MVAVVMAVAAVAAATVAAAVSITLETANTTGKLPPTGHVAALVLHKHARAAIKAKYSR